ncbi:MULTISPECIES: TldD/PmbA family protein [Oceanotoga]|jgi:PmbA protein|uniref:PmbA protein n=1 Tax=Oceanotoga teriensis TaxID=515440 RepID=A0AA45HHS0_9BACT|nr:MULTISPECIES: TldD/PmbA family protein [Oceanotoga]MDN5342813.1 PmbA protein [Oceanotoga sp.]PWJ87529.1 PmbA protein [Oceanotoga teriensis]
MMKDILLNICENTKQKGFDVQINVFISKEKKASFSNQKLEELSEGEKGTAGIKLINKDGKKSTSTTNIITEEGIKEAIEKAIEMNEFSEEDSGNIISDQKDFEFMDWTYDKTTAEIELNDIIEMAKELEKKALSLDDKIKFVRGSSVETSTIRNYFVNSNKVFKQSYFTVAEASITLAAIYEEDSSMGFDFDVQSSIRNINLDRIAKNACEKALSGLNSTLLNSGRYDIILSPFASAMLLSVLSTPLSGESVYKGKSFLGGKLEKQIASKKVTLLHDPMNGSAPIMQSYDNEGINTSRFNFIEKGVLKNFAHNLYSAKKLGMKPTGNAFASSNSGIPIISTINMHLMSTSTRKNIINKEKALYITQMMGLHTADPISGRFSIQISGQLIENGEFTKSFRGMTLAGTLSELLENIEEIGSDFKYMGSIAGSTTLIKNMSIGGK